MTLHADHASHETFLHEKIGHFLAHPNLKKICISNVAGPHFADEIINQIGSTVPCNFITSVAREAGIENAYEDPGQLGSDRWLAMIAAYQIVRGAVCVVDFGSAITIDMLSASGRHQGGIIIPGFKMMQTCISKGLGHLPCPSELKKKPSLLGTDTVSAIQSGLLHPVTALIEKLLQKNPSQQDHVSLVITGGQARYSGLVDLPNTLYRPHLVLEGMACLLQRPEL